MNIAIGMIPRDLQNIESAQPGDLEKKLLGGSNPCDLEVEDSC